MIYWLDSRNLKYLPVRITITQLQSNFIVLVEVIFVTEKTVLCIHNSSLWFNKSIMELRKALWVLWKNPAQ